MHNEAGNIEKMAVSLLAIKSEIDCDMVLFIVNDGSTDASADICKNLAQDNPSIRCINHHHNIGYGGAIISGFRASEGDYVAIIDADGQFDALDFVKLFRYTDSFDVVVGYRQCRADPLARRILGRVWTLTGKWLFHIPIRDLNCGLKIFKHSLIEDLELRCHGPGINLEIMAQIVALGIPIKEFPCSHFPRTTGTQSGGSLRVVKRALPELLYVLLWKFRKRRRTRFRDCVTFI